MGRRLPIQEECMADSHRGTGAHPNRSEALVKLLDERLALSDLELLCNESIVVVVDSILAARDEKRKGG